MKRRKFITPIAIGTILSMSMAVSAMAGTTDTAAVSTSVTEAAAEIQDPAVEAAQEQTVIYGRITNIDGDKVEIEVAEEEKAEEVSAEAAADTQEQAGAEAASGTEEQPLELTLNGEKETIALEDSTVFSKEKAAEEDAEESGSNDQADASAAVAASDDSEDQAADAGQAVVAADSEDQANAANTETIKKDDLKKDDIVKVVEDKDGKVVEVTVLVNAEIKESSEETSK